MSRNILYAGPLTSCALAKLSIAYPADASDGTRISVSGIAGPTGGSKLKPVGLVNFCIKGPKTLITWEENFGSNKTREDIQKLSVLNALDRLRLSIIMAN